MHILYYQMTFYCNFVLKMLFNKIGEMSLGVMEHTIIKN